MRTIRSSAIILAFTLAATASDAAETQSQTCVSACPGLLHRYAYDVDHQRYDTALELYAADVVVDMPGGRRLDKAGFAQFLRARPADDITRHIFANILVDQHDTDRATVRSYVVLFQADRASPQPLAATAPSTVAEIEDDFRLSAMGWKIVHRKVNFVFRRP